MPIFSAKAKASGLDLLIKSENVTSSSVVFFGKDGPGFAVDQNGFLFAVGCGKAYVVVVISVFGEKSYGNFGFQIAFFRVFFYVVGAVLGGFFESFVI